MSGLTRYRYVGYFADNVNFFDNSASLYLNTGDPITDTSINVGDLGTAYSLQWLGYFLAPETGNYRFRTASDDASYLWIGSNAISGYTTGNATVNNGGLHGVVTITSASVPLIGGTHYPIRIQFGENAGGALMTVSFEVPSNPSVFTINGLGYYFTFQSSSIPGGTSSGFAIGTNAVASTVRIAGNDGTVNFYPRTTYISLNFKDNWTDINNDYNLLSRNGDQNFFINRRSGHEMEMRENNGTTQLRFSTTAPGTVTLTGNLTKGSGTFDIEHPILEGKRLRHSLIEAPRCDNLYRGTKQLVNGHAIVNIDLECGGTGMTDGTFVALNQNPVSYVKNNNSSFDQVRSKINGNLLEIWCENPNSNDTVIWIVMAERKDPYIKQWSGTDSDGHLILEVDE